MLGVCVRCELRNKLVTLGQAISACDLMVNIGVLVGYTRYVFYTILDAFFGFELNPMGDVYLGIK